MFSRFMNVQYKGPLVTMGEVEDKNATASKMRSYRASGCADLLPGTAVLLLLLQRPKLIVCPHHMCYTTSLVENT